VIDEKWLTVMSRNVDLADFVDSCDLFGPFDQFTEA